MHVAVFDVNVLVSSLIMKGKPRDLWLKARTNEFTLLLSNQIVSVKTLNPLDALHVSSACIGKADWFLTCDDEILQNGRCIEELATEKGYRLKVRNPINYPEEKHGWKK